MLAKTLHAIKSWFRKAPACRRKDVLAPNIKIGHKCRIFGNPRLKAIEGAEIVCGDGVVLNSNPDGYHAAMSIPVTMLADRPCARIVIGADSRLHGCFIHAWDDVTIGRKCLIAAGAQIIDSNGHSTELQHARVRTRLQDAPIPINIADFVWIATGALILKGAKIGEGCIVAANSVVLEGEYPPFSIIAGAPARVVHTIDACEVLPEDYAISELAINGMSEYQY
jgi:acetyltransferase-like isoleucine patch superfamily enzyme